MSPLPWGLFQGKKLGAEGVIGREGTTGRQSHGDTCGYCQRGKNGRPQLKRLMYVYESERENSGL